VATIDLVLRAINRVSKPLQDIAAAADRTADRIDSLNERIEQVDHSMAAFEGAARLAESGMSSAGREADILSGKLSILSDRLDDLDRTVHVRVKADVDKSWLSRLGGRSGGGGIGGLLSGLLPGGGGIGGLMPLLSDVFSSGGPLGSAGPAVGAVGGVATAGAAVFALANAAAATAGVITGTLGAALAGLGIAGAIGATAVAKSFAQLKADATNDLTAISTPFQGVLINIANAFRSVLPDVMQPLSVVFQTMAGPLQLIGTTLAKSFANPAIGAAIWNVGKAFAAFLNSFAPQIPGIVGAIAKGISGMAQAFTDHPGMIAGMSSVLAFMLRLPGYAFAVLGALTRVASWFYTGLPHEVSRGLDDTRKAIEDGVLDIERWWNDLDRDTRLIWNDIFGSTIGVAIRLGHDVETQFDSLRHSTANVFDGIRHDLLAWGDGAITWLLQAGKDVITGFWHGLTFIWDKVMGWFSGIAGWIAAHKGPLSLDQKLLYPHGQAIMGGFYDGLKHKFREVQGFMGGIGTTVAASAANLGGNVQSWIMAALADTNAPLSWLGPLEVLVAKESGGNPYAVNPIAVMGEHASGIAQTLPSTYAQFATVPGGVFNAVSDLVAAIRYIRATYGSPYNIPGLMSGTYTGYDSGGILPPGFHLVANLTGRNEQVVPAGGGADKGMVEELLSDIAGSLDEAVGRLDQVVGLLATQTRAGVAAAGAGRSAGYRAMYSTRG
jgi:SLT domain-containing protein